MKQFILATTAIFLLGLSGNLLCSQWPYQQQYINQTYYYQPYQPAIQGYYEHPYYHYPYQQVSQQYYPQQPATATFAPGVIAYKEFSKATAYQFQSCQQYGSTCGGFCVANACAIRDLINQNRSITPATVQEVSGTTYRATPWAVHIYNILSGNQGLNGDQVLTYARAHSLINVFYLHNNFKIYDQNGEIDPNWLRNQITRLNNFIGYFISYVPVGGCEVGHGVLNVIITNNAQNQRPIIIHLDSLNNNFQTNLTSSYQMLFLSELIA